MAEFNALEVLLWGNRVGVISWNEKRHLGEFEYDPDFIKSGLEISPLTMPLSKKVYRFPELIQRDTFLGLPGLIADSMTEKYGNELMKNWLAKKGMNYSDLTPVERLGYIGKRGMGALEYQPDADQNANQIFDVNVSELVNVAREVLCHHNTEKFNLLNDGILHKLIQISTSAGGAKAKALIAFNEKTNEIISGQAECQPEFEHWILKFSDIENTEHLTDKYIGRLEYAYHKMAVEAGIHMMESRLIHDGARDHFMTRRFDRIAGAKAHVQTFCALAHEDRNPVGNTHYETLFTTARKLKLGQESLNELYRRMVFNILARNQDDHSKNHAFIMDAFGKWMLAPAYDLVFTYKKDSRWIDKQQMCCNGKRDHFTRHDLHLAAQAADIKKPDHIIAEVQAALKLWPEIALETGLPQEQTTAIQQLFRKL